MKPLAIGALARETGAKPTTIRFYEDIGLLPRPPRTESNRRTYDEPDVKRLRFIRHARELGFEVDAIRQLLSLADHPDRPCQDVDRIAREHLHDIEGKIALSIKVGPTGQVASVAATKTGNLPESVVDCVKARANSANFSAPQGGAAVVQVPVSFVKQ